MDVEQIFRIINLFNPCKKQGSDLVKKELERLKRAQRLKKKPEEMRIAVYLRKSTETEERQQHSIADQEKECLAWASHRGITIRKDDIFREETSARYAGNRPIFFGQVLMGVIQGKYDAILAYHPDRLARNMFEAGLLLDMLKPVKKDKSGKRSSRTQKIWLDDHEDEEPPILQNLFFPTVEFTNDSGGRLMLAVLFSMATQYSDHLSEVVQRGVDSHFSAGKSIGARKWGYKRDETTGHYVPDGNWNHIKTGWDMALAGKSQAEVLDYWKSNGVQRISKPKGNGQKPTIQLLKGKNSASTIFHDPFYCGINTKNGQTVNLCDIDPNFKPMVTQEEFNKVAKRLKANLHVQRQRRDSDLFLPLRGCVRCSSCGGAMTPQATRKNTSVPRKYIYYSCHNRKCTNKASIRGKDLFDQLYKILDTLTIKDAAQQKYIETAKNYATKKVQELKKERNTYQGQLTQAETKLNKATSDLTNLAALSTANGGGDDADQEAINRTRSSIESIKADIRSLKSKIQDANEKIKDPEMIVLEAEAFSNLLKTAADQMRKRNLAGKDALFRVIFSNLTVTPKKEVRYLCKPELNGLLDFDNSRMVE